ncbi:MAG: GNAT family N-acetyltransferase [Candidatus Micrarchaeia archaeon]
MAIIEKLDAKELLEASKFAQSVMNSTYSYNKNCRMSNSKGFSPNKLRESMKHGELFVAKDDSGKIIGFADYYPSLLYPAKAGVGYLNWVFVDKSYRRKGLGAALTKRLFDSAKNHGQHAVWTEILASNYKSIRLSKKMGFKKVGLFKKAWYKQDYYILYKKL